MISIIIPAHNEGKYIAETLKHIQELSYPKDSYEALVIENGSNDDTLAISKKFEDENIKVFSVQTKGVSKAKNFGMKNISAKSEWMIFLDADTILESNFLNELSEYLEKNKDKNLVVGTTSVKPLENKGLYATAWMKFYDLGHKYTKTSFAIQIARSSLKDKVSFNEEIHLAEDLQFLKECLKFGNFLYLDTDTVLTSTRRFEKIGWLRLFLKWNFDALMWRFRDPKQDYPVIR
jgi:glycosyltransferase involved in cell wall biosynthesis